MPDQTTDQERMERLQAMIHLLTAEVYAVTYLLRAAQVRLAEVSPGWTAKSPLSPLDLQAPGLDFGSEFARLRRQNVQQQLEVLSDKEPGVAARIQELLERSCTVGYEEEDLK